MTAPAALHTTTQELTFTIERPAGEPITITPDTERVRVWYGYTGAPVHAHAVAKPHELELHVVGLRAGESLEVHLMNLKGGHLTPAEADALLHSIFPTASPATHGFGWELPFGSPPVPSGEAFSSLGKHGRLRIKYDLELYRGDRLLAELDPDIKLIPDP